MMVFMPKPDRNLARLALGDKSDFLWTDLTFTWEQLQSNNWKVRFVSFTALIDHWHLKQREATKLARQLIENDPHTQVVNIAINSLGKLCENSFDSAQSRYVANIAMDNSQPVTQPINPCATSTARLRTCLIRVAVKRVLTIKLNASSQL